MQTQTQSDPHSTQTGGITILVALMMLVLLTIAAVGMSRNSFREIVTSGFSRQGAMARNVADSGIEWSIHWIDIQNGKVATTGEAQKMVTVAEALLHNSTLQGVAKDIDGGTPTATSKYTPGGTLQADLKVPGPTGVTQGFTVGLTLMGKSYPKDTSFGPGGLTLAPGAPVKLAPDLWAIRSDAQVKQGEVTFIHAKEAWVSTPVRY